MLDMRVQKRNGAFEDVSFDKVLRRIQLLSAKDLSVNVYEIAQSVCTRIYDGVQTRQLDELASQLCSSLIVRHPDYGELAARIAISNHHKNTSPSFSETVRQLYENYNYDGIHAPLVSTELFEQVMRNKEKFNAYIDYSRDFSYDYFGWKTLEKSYLLKRKGAVVERPQHMLMRVAIGIHGGDMKDTLKTYDMMSMKLFTHASPTLFNAGTPRPQCSSCFLYAMKEDSIDGIFRSLADVAQISKYSGGIGIHMHNIRSNGSLIRGTNGTSTGIVPMLRIFNNTARYVNQSGKRNGSIAVYLEPWHGDIESFLDLKKNHGNEEDRCRDLFLALWIPDLFMKRVEENGMWSLMCPDACKGLGDCYGADFEELYIGFEREGKFIKKVRAQDLWFKILESQIETGTPYIMYKDACNAKSNQKNLGTIKSSNLCAEIIEYSDPEETAVCNLSSLGLPMFVDVSGRSFDHGKLHEATKVVTHNLNKIIDVNFYPIESARRSNLRHRPVGIGVQGLADVFALLRYPYDSQESRELNKDIFETIYHAALEASMEIARKRHQAINIGDPDSYVAYNEYESSEVQSGKRFPGAYVSFEGSPASLGILQFDMWGVSPGSGRYDWDALKKDICTYGLRNSLLVAPMPTASTAQILGNNESFEPFTSNLFKRKTLSGEFIVINKYLLRDLIERDLWDERIKDQLILNDGSIQGIKDVPSDLKELYKTVWEIKQKAVIDMCIDRGAFVDQSQSMNLFVEDPDFKRMTSMHFYAWKNGLKCGIYYLRTRPRAASQKFTIDPHLEKAASVQAKIDADEARLSSSKSVVCDAEVCVACSG